MAAFATTEGTDWISPVAFGLSTDRWRLDDFHVFAQVKMPGENVAVLDLSTVNGLLVITDPVARVMEVNVGWGLIEPLGFGVFEFDFLFANRTTGVLQRTEPHTLTVSRGVTLNITLPEA